MWDVSEHVDHPEREAEFAGHAGRDGAEPDPVASLDDIQEDLGRCGGRSM